MKIGVDKNQLTGTHAYSNRWKHYQMEKLGAELIPLRVPFGDYILITPDIEKLIADKGLEAIHKSDLRGLIKCSVDTKKNLVELSGNVCQGHERFKRELIKPMQELNSKLIILVEEKDIHSIEDVYFWENPRLKDSPRATKGTALYKSMCTIRDEYNVEFEFCSRAETGKKLIEILRRENGEE